MIDPSPRELLLATANPGKRREFLNLLPAGITVLTLADVAITLPPEIEPTFQTIADRKATYASTASGKLALADDSGLIVDALDGAPGTFSARYAGEPPSDARNRGKLFAALHDVPAAARSARFICAVSLADGNHVIARAEGWCEGTIAFAEAGANGFGYDAMFLLPTGETMAEIDASTKNRISHRAQAYARILPALHHALGLSPVSGEVA